MPKQKTKVNLVWLALTSEWAELPPSSAIAQSTVEESSYFSQHRANANGNSQKRSPSIQRRRRSSKGHNL